MFQLPTHEALVQRARQAFRVNLKGSDASVWPNNIYVSAKVVGGAIFEVFGFAAYIQKQMFAHTAPDLESLLLHGQEYGIARKPAAPGAGKVTFDASEALTVETAAVLERTDGIQYRVVSGGSLATAGTLTLDVIATTDGVESNLENGASLEIISGVTGDATVTVGPDSIVLGVDLEDIESYRQRILFRKRNPIHGGAPSDYVLWTGEVAGVSFVEDRPTVFVERLWNGPGTVRVFPLMFDLYANGIPQAADIARVKDYLETVKPAGAMLTVAAPVPVEVPVIITNLKPDTPQVRANVLAELQDAFKRLARVAGSDTYFGSMPYLAYPTEFSVSWIWQAVANATGEASHNISSPSTNIALSAGEYPVLGDVTYA